MSLSRRQFLRRGAAALLLPGAIEALAARIAAAAPGDAGAIRAAGYGPLLRDPAGLLDLPAGFTYRALSTSVLDSAGDLRFRQTLANGDPVPPLHDGMAAFAGPDGTTILVRNHELEPGDGPAVDPAGSGRYDRLACGGTTTLWVSAGLEVQRAFASLSGTFRNCAGGATPWGSWLTAEECTYLPGPADPVVHDRRPDVAERHGYVFEVDARAGGLVEPVPIVAMGRFYHEALAVDPVTGFVYLTEDRDDGLLYRYRPDAVVRQHKRVSELAVGDLARGGALEALRIVGRPGMRTQNWDGRAVAPGVEWLVDWVRIPEVDPDADMERDPADRERPPLERRPRTAPGSTRGQGQALGAAQFARVEGITWHRGALHFCATNGGRARAGQVWRLVPATRRLALAHEPDDRTVLEGPDNLVPAPNGDLIVCEDGRNEDFVVGITPAGRFYPIARNAYGSSEFAGACFAADGRTMFVNMQEPGITFAIRGPWAARGD